MKKQSVKILISCFILILASIKVTAQNVPVNIANSLQEILDNALPVGLQQSGVVMSVTIPGQWTWSGASGFAISGMNPLYPETMATPASKFRVGSITKTFVAACILKLEEAGLLSIEDPIDNYLRPTLVNDTIMSSGTVKIRHLLNHTSGIANSADNQNCQTDVLNNPLTEYTYEDAIYCGTSQGEIFPPEFAWAYSNTNYSILAMIIEEVSGMSYPEYVSEQIFTPLNLQNTEIPLNAEISGEYMGCYWNIGSWIDLSVIHPSIYRGWADIVSTTEDLNMFYMNLLNGNIVSQTSLQKMKLIDPASFDYGLGLDFYLLGGDDYYGHSGEVANSSSMFYSNLSSGIAPDGYYISFNFNIQGVNMSSLIDIPVYDVLNNSTAQVEEVAIKHENRFSIFPNPAKEYLTVNNILGLNTEYIIHNVSGQQMESGKMNSTKLNINLSGYDSGIYLITILSKEYSEKYRFIIL